MNSIDFIATPVFAKNAKLLSKRYPSFANDLRELRQSLVENPEQGVRLNNGFRKIRMAIASKGKGKSGGARVITLNYLHDELDGKIVLVTVYDKSDRSSITDKEIRQALNGVEE